MNLILLLLINSMITQECGKGCLSCTQEANNPIQKCVIFDVINLYYWNASQNILERQKLEGCIIMNHLGQCYSCETQYSLDLSTQKCVKVTQTITNCIQYSDNSCQHCNSSSILQLGECRPVENIIDHCLRHRINNNVSYCSLCEEDYYLSRSQQKCEKLIKINNCLKYSYFKCQKCLQTHLINHNYEKKKIQEQFSMSQQQRDTLSDLIVKYWRNDSQIVNLSVCQPLKTINCQEYSDPNNCKQCNSGYYVNNGKCTKNPDSIITNCQLYSSSSVCQSCLQGYYLKNQSLCEKVKNIENCELYSTTHTSTQCQQCQNDKYYLSGGKCNERLIEVNFCQKYKIDEDNCEICQNSHVLNDSKKNCASKLLNCLIHFTNFQNDAIDSDIKCKECDLGYQVNQNGKCEAITIENCQKVENGNCILCENQFYSLNGVCNVKHSNLEKCLKYSQTATLGCEECDDSIALNLTKKCIRHDKVEGCVGYHEVAGNWVCQECQKGKFLTNNTCQPIIDSQNRLIQHCQSSLNNQCTECFPLYGLVKDIEVNNLTKTCQSPEIFWMENCEEIQVNQTQLIASQCLSCKPNHFSHYVPKAFRCSPDRYFKDIFGEIDKIQNCVRYSINDQNTMICNECITGYFVQHDSLSCIENCGNGYQTLIYDQQKRIYQKSKCLSPLIEPAYQIKAPVVNNGLQNFQYNEQTIQCKSSFQVYQVFTQEQTNNLNQSQIVNHSINDTISYSNVKIQQNNFQQGYIDNPFHISPIIRCYIIAASDNQTQINDIVHSNSNSLKNCQYYLYLEENQLSPNRLNCLKCPQGTLTSKIQNGYIKDCSGTCQGVQEYFGIPSFWSKFFSCSQCLNQEIPVIIYEATAKDNFEFKNFVDFDLGQSDFTGNVVNQMSNIKCMNNSSTTLLKQSLGMTSVDSNNLSVMPGCGLAFLNLAYSDAVNFNNKSWNQDTMSTDKHGLLCGACLPGYKPLFYKDNLPFVKSCTQIQYCEQNNKVFNKCESCELNYAWGWDDIAQKPLTDTCVAIPNNQVGKCLAYLQTTSGSTLGKCQICKKGYHLNQDGECQVIFSKFCKDNQWFDQDGGFYHSLNYFVSQEFQGCLNNCLDSYFSLQNQNYIDQNLCLESVWFKQKSGIFGIQNGNISKFITHCLNYNNSSGNAIKCHKCQPNYVLTQDGSQCITQNNLTNCLLAQNSKICLKCEINYGLITDGTEKICKVNSISKCLRVDRSQQFGEVQEVKCLACESGYYLNEQTNECLVGEVLNCLEYDKSKDLCSLCRDGYWGIGTYNTQTGQNGNIRYCLPVRADQQCAEFDFDQDSQTLECKKCEHLYDQLQDLNQSDPVKLCFNYNKIPNCITHKKILRIDQESFVCTLCENDYFLQPPKEFSKKCLKRVEIIENCQKLKIDEDKCEQCNIGYYLSSSGTSCIKNPEGIFKCQNFSSQNTCSQCQKEYYLFQNECFPVELIVQNCEDYLNRNTCISCSQGYFLKNNQCLSTEVSNCQEFQSVNSCKKCTDGFILVNENNNLICQSFTIPGCVIYDYTSAICVACSSQYYVEPKQKKSCVSANTISNCVIMDSKTECQQCNSAFALAEDKKSCVSKENYDVNCSQTIILREPQCTLCSAGYEMGSDGCLKEGEENVDGCFVYQGDNKSCLICSPGYYMKEIGKCLSESTTIVPTITAFASLVSILILSYLV